MIAIENISGTITIRFSFFFRVAFFNKIPAMEWDTQDRKKEKNYRKSTSFTRSSDWARSLTTIFASDIVYRVSSI